MGKDCLLNCEAMKACRNELEAERWSKLNDLGRMSDLQRDKQKLKECVEMFISYLNFVPLDYRTEHENNMFFSAQKCLKELEAGE